MYFDISPNGSRIAYPTCAYTEVAERELDSLGLGYFRQIVVSDIYESAHAERKEGSRAWFYNYEIVVSDIYGTNVKRLTENIHFDSFPTWSPDRATIAFISESKHLYLGWELGDRSALHLRGGRLRPHPGER